MDKYLAQQMKDELYVALKAITCDNGCDPRRGAINLDAVPLRYRACCEDFEKKAEKILGPIRRKYQSPDHKS